MKMRMFVMMLVVACTLTGCLEYQTRILVNPDGTGKVIQRVLMKKSAVEMIQGMKDAIKDSSQQIPDDMKNSLMYDEADIRKKAQSIGEMVQYLSSRALDTAGMVGYEAIYAFQDISKIKIAMNIPGADNKSVADNLPAQQIQTIAGRSAFQFVKGSPATLTIAALPDSMLKKARGSKEKSSSMKNMSMSDTTAREFIKTFFEGMRVSVTVEPQGTIVETNAAYRADGTITLFDLDFNTLLSDEKAWNNLTKQKPKNPAQIKKLMKTLPGIKVETEKVTVKFQ